MSIRNGRTTHRESIGSRIAAVTGGRVQCVWGLFAAQDRKTHGLFGGLALRVHLGGVPWDMIKTVMLSKQAEKDLRSAPRHIAVKLQDWVEDVKDRGIEEVRKIPGYHDEPLRGRLDAFRSIRLSKGYRAYYRVMRNEIEFVRVERVDKHVY